MSANSEKVIPFPQPSRDFNELSTGKSGAISGRDSLLVSFKESSAHIEEGSLIRPPADERNAVSSAIGHLGRESRSRRDVNIPLESLAELSRALELAQRLLRDWGDTHDLSCLNAGEGAAYSVQSTSSAQGKFESRKSVEGEATYVDLRFGSWPARLECGARIATAERGGEDRKVDIVPVGATFLRIPRDLAAKYRDVLIEFNAQEVHDLPQDRSPPPGARRVRTMYGSSGQPFYPPKP